SRVIRRNAKLHGAIERLLQAGVDDEFAVAKECGRQAKLIRPSSRHDGIGAREPMNSFCTCWASLSAPSRREGSRAIVRHCPSTESRGMSGPLFGEAPGTV